MKSAYPLTFKSILFYWVLFIILGVNAMYTSRGFVALFYFTVIVMSYLLIKDQGGDIKFGNGIWWGFGLGTAAITIIFVLEYAAGLIEVKGISDITVITLAVALCFQMLVCIGEELSFRGYILQNMVSEIKPVWAVFYSSALFSLIHVPSIIYYRIAPEHGIIMFTTLLLFSVIASQLYLKFGLLSAIGVHFSWNVMQYYIFTMQSRSAGLLDVEYLSSMVVSGGGHGPEAGLLGVIVLAAGIVFVHRFLGSSSD